VLPGDSAGVEVDGPSAEQPVLDLFTLEECVQACDVAELLPVHRRSVTHGPRNDPGPDSGRPVGQDHDARLERCGVDEVEHRERRVSVELVIGSAVSDEERMHPQAELVKESRTHEGVGDRPEAALDGIFRPQPKVLIVSGSIVMT
jgi:hypothetical protein